jgi:hypothetical protein
MEVFRLKHAKLVTYYFRNMYPKTIKRMGTVNITRTFSILNNKLLPLVINQYAHFLADFFKRIGYEGYECLEEELKMEISHYVRHSH